MLMLKQEETRKHVRIEKYIELTEQYDNLKISTDRSIEMYYLGEKSQSAAYAFLADNLIKRKVR